MSMNLRHMGFNEALDAAKQRSGLTNEAIANRSSLSTAAVSRYFNKYDDYTPSPELIPPPCAGRSATPSLRTGSRRRSRTCTRQRTSPPRKTSRVRSCRRPENTGILNKKTLDAVADGELSPSEAATIQAQFRANAKWNNEAADAPDPLAGGQSLSPRIRLCDRPRTGREAPDERVGDFSEQGSSGPCAWSSTEVSRGLWRGMLRRPRTETRDLPDILEHDEQRPIVDIIHTLE